jgi:DNA-binding transcriptional ArsR family regulator
VTRRSAPSRLDWLGLLDISGPFLSPPVIDRVFPQGLDVLDTDHAAKLRLAREDWAESQVGPDPDPLVHDEWVGLVLGETLGFTPEVVMDAGAIPATLAMEVPEYDTVVRPDLVVAEPAGDGEQQRTRLLIHVYPLRQDLEAGIEGSAWAAAPSTRMTQLCRAAGVRLGLVTNGERRMLVDAPAGETSAYVSWYSSLWTQEPDTLRAFRSLLHARRFFGVDESETLERMLVDSASYQAEVTEQLGAQVRRAIEVLVRALDRSDVDTGRELLAGVGESELYEAAITVMMRLVFLFFAEESGLLLLGDEMYDQYYSASMLRGQLREEADKVGVEVLERRQDAWSRLLATFRGIFAGVDHESLHLPAYGGSLFDPDRFPFLEGREPGTTWMDAEATPLPIDNRTVLLLLDALQVLQTGGRGGEARRLSFRALDIEQIGHVYESLLDHVAVRASSPILGLVGPRGAEPEVSLDDLDALRERGEPALVEFLADKTKKSRSTLNRALGRQADPDVVARQRVACGDDEQLLARVLPHHAIVRDDPWGDPVVVQAGSIFVTAGPERRGTGTYYTPRALAEEVVTHALEPLVYRGPADGKPRDEWELKPPLDLLELKICDFAMGSGAFLVQVCRWLGERLVESWQRAGANETLITPEGVPATGNPSETIVPAGSEERRVLARRLIADRCLYGVDVNTLAVEMAKLSLWLITLAKGRPFSFLDHALKCGDSLLGVHDLNQMRHFHVDPDRGRELHSTLFDPTRPIEPAIEEALRLRRELESFTVLDVRDARHKAALHQAAEAAVERLRMVGDLLIGTAVSTAERGKADLEAKLSRLADRLSAGIEGGGGSADPDLLREARVMLNEGKPESQAPRRPLHWPLEFPEVFLRDRPGFDAIVGNPPFRGGKKITGTLGVDYRAFLVLHVAEGLKGNADLVAYFYLRADTLARKDGVVGLLATNTISQGDTRAVGLEQLASRGWSIVKAWKSRLWPGDASIQIAEVWLWLGEWHGPAVLDDIQVRQITPSLDARTRVSGSPYSLPAATAKAFIGSLLNGIGFVLEPREANNLIRRNVRNKDVLFPYLTGEDLNSSPTQSPARWVINFFDWPLERAEDYPDCLAIVRERVKPQRDRLGDTKRREREAWWQFERRAVNLYNAIDGFERVIAIAAISKTLMPIFVSTGIVFSHKTIVIAFSDPEHLGLFSSAFHWWWTVKYTSTLRTDINYSPTDCFETFPEPALTERVGHSGKTIDEYRRAVMIERKEGLTKTYNRVHDSEDTAADVAELRRLQVELDHAVAAAYGWSDLKFDHDFYDTPQGVRYTIAPAVRIEVLDRLLELNHERQRAETAEGLLSSEGSRESVGG